MSTLVKINVTIETRTKLGILVSDGRRKVWMPLSQVVEEIKEPTPPLGIVATTAIVVQDWVATEKGLQPCQQDDATMDFFGGAS